MSNHLNKLHKTLMKASEYNVDYNLLVITIILLITEKTENCVRGVLLKIFLSSFMFDTPINPFKDILIYSLLFLNMFDIIMLLRLIHYNINSYKLHKVTLQSVFRLILLILTDQNKPYFVSIIQIKN